MTAQQQRILDKFTALIRAFTDAGDTAFASILGIERTSLLAIFAPPAARNLHHPLETVDLTTPAGVRWLAACNRASPPYALWAFNFALAFRLTGDIKYAIAAVKVADGWVQAAIANVAAGKLPQVAGDSYLHAFAYISEVAYTLQWCDEFLTPTQRDAFQLYCSQAVFNIWNWGAASWYGKRFPWTGWSTSNPGNNYHYSFIGATMCWALYSGDQQWHDKLRNDKLPKLVAYMQNIPDGGSREGVGYGVSHSQLFEDYLIWKTSTGEDLSILSTHCLKSIPYWVHATCPNLKNVAPIGDLTKGSSAPVNDYQRSLLLWAVALNPDSREADWGRWWLRNVYPKATAAFSAKVDMIADIGIASIPAALSYGSPRVGHYFARSSWQSDATFLDFNTGPRTESHAHQANGAFDFWGAGGWLCVTENTHTKSGIVQTTPLHNMLRFESSGVLRGQWGTSGPAFMNDNGVTMVAQMELSPGYAGITWNRKLVFLRPSMLVVDDWYVTPPGTIAYFQLQTPVQPTISGNIITAGRLKATVTLPTAPVTITVEPWSILTPGNYFSPASAGWRTSISDPANAGRFSVTLEVQ